MFHWWLTVHTIVLYSAVMERWVLAGQSLSLGCVIKRQFYIWTTQWRNYINIHVQSLDWNDEFLKGGLSSFLRVSSSLFESRQRSSDSLVPLMASTILLYFSEARMIHLLYIIATCVFHVAKATVDAVKGLESNNHFDDLLGPGLGSRTFMTMASDDSLFRTLAKQSKFTF